MPGAQRSTAPLSFEKPVGLSSGADRADGDHVRQAGGELERVAVRRTRCRRRRPAPRRRLTARSDLRAPRRCTRRRAVAHVDHRGAGARSRAAMPRAESAQVIALAVGQRDVERARARPDAEHADAVGRRGRDRARWRCRGSRAARRRRVVVMFEPAISGWSTSIMRVDERDQRAVGRRRRAAPGRRRRSRASAPVGESGSGARRLGAPAEPVRLGVVEQAARRAARRRARARGRAATSQAPPAIRRAPWARASAAAAGARADDPGRRGRPRTAAARGVARAARRAGADGAFARPAACAGGRPRQARRRRRAPPGGSEPSRRSVVPSAAQRSGLGARGARRAPAPGGSAPRGTRPTAPEQRLEHRLGADRVAPGERAARVVEAELHAGVDVGGACRRPRRARSRPR